MEKYTALRSLCVHGHALTAIDGLQGLRQLTDLNLSANAITSLAGLECLRALQFLNLSRNHLTSTAGLGQCTRLQRLVLSSNYITSLGGLGDLGAYAPQLSVVDLRANQLADVEELRHLVGCVLSLSVAAQRSETKCAALGSVCLRSRSASYPSSRVALQTVSISGLLMHSVPRSRVVNESRAWVPGMKSASPKSARYTDTRGGPLSPCVDVNP